MAIGAAGVIFKIFQSTKVALIGLIEKIGDLELTNKRVTWAAAEGGFQGEVDQVIGGSVCFCLIKEKEPILRRVVFEPRSWIKGREQSLSDMAFITQGANPLEGRDKGKVALRIEATHEGQHVVPLEKPFWMDVKGSLSAVEMGR